MVVESVPRIGDRFAAALLVAEWVFTGLFTLEYLLRLYCIGRARSYALSFYGLIDFLAIAPSLLSLLVPGIQSLLVIRVLRLLRIFRVLKLPRFIGESSQLVAALTASARKIAIFTGTVLMLVLIVGAMMYLIEGEENGFTSIPISIYWTIVTLTTVGYGDIAPQTSASKLLADVCGDDHGIWGYCRADRHRHGRTVAGSRPAGEQAALRQHPDLPAMRRRRP